MFWHRFKPDSNHQLSDPTLPWNSKTGSNHSFQLPASGSTFPTLKRTFRNKTNDDFLYSHVNFPFPCVVDCIQLDVSASIKMCEVIRKKFQKKHSIICILRAESFECCYYVFCWNLLIFKITVSIPSFNVFNIMCQC